MGEPDPTMEVCSCGAMVAPWDGPAHAYIGATPGCWRVYCEVIGAEYTSDASSLTRRLIVDAYAAQHPGVESRRAIQSVAGHLIALHLLLDQGRSADFVTSALVRAVEQSDRYRWLTPPDFAGTVNVAAIAAVGDVASRERIAREWAASVWDSWREHHGTVRGWAVAIV